MLEKRQIVLEQINWGGSSVTFGYTDEDTQKDVSVLTLSHDDFDQFGEPEHLTLTIVPGDLLNV